MSPSRPEPDAAGSLSPERVAGLIESNFWVRVEGGGQTASTNDDARDLARAGAPEGTVVIASAQTRGRGRMGREWASRRGGIYLSAVLRPAVSANALSSLPLAVGVGVVRGIERALGGAMGIGLKWPNDVVWRGRKLAGILVESEAGTRGVAWVVAGVGINVRWDSRTVGDAAWLAELGYDGDLTCLAAHVLDGIAATYATFESSGFAAMREEYLGRSVTVGGEVVVSDADGAVVAEGVAADVDNAGRLVVETPSGPVAVSSGDVTLRPPRA